MSSMNSGAGQARIAGCIVTLVAVLMTAVTTLLWATLPVAPTSDDLIAAGTVTAVTVVLYAVGLPLWLVGARRLARQRRVLHSGTPCVATLVDVDRLTDPEDDNPVSRITLAVPVAGGGSVTAVVRQVVPRRLVRWFRPGLALPVRVDPADPTFAVIDWEHLQQRQNQLGSAVGGAAGNAAIDLVVAWLT